MGADTNKKEEKAVEMGRGDEKRIDEEKYWKEGGCKRRDVQEIDNVEIPYVGNMTFNEIM